MIEIQSGLFYDETTGKPFSNRKGPLRELKGKHNRGYPMVGINNKVIMWHRLVWEHFNGPIPDGMQIDHIDNNVENPKIENLQLVTQKQNSRKTLLNKRNKSGYKGVSWSARLSKWQAHIKANGKSKYLCYSDDPIDCARAYDRKAIELFGEDFALTNEKMGLL